jgi:hypothetical protein
MAYDPKLGYDPALGQPPASGTPNLGFGGIPASNPYTALQGQALQNSADQNLKLNVLPTIASGAEAAGGYGGSRQGIAEGVATGLSNEGVANAQANLYGNAYGQDENFYTQQRSLDQSGAALGANLNSQGIAGDMSQGQGIYNLGTTQQQAPYTNEQNAGNIYSQFSGLGGSQTSTLNGSTIGGALGGAIGGAQLIKNLGLGSAASPTAGYTAPQTLNSSGAYTDPYQAWSTPPGGADGGPVRAQPVIGSRTALPSSGAGPMDRAAILAALQARGIPLNLGMSGMASLPTNPVTNPQGIIAAQVQQADKYMTGGRISYQNGGPAVGGPPGKDKIPAWVNDGENIIRTSAVTALGKGSNAKGQNMLDRMQSALDGKPPGRALDGRSR